MYGGLYFYFPGARRIEMKMKKLRPNGVMLENGIVLSYDDPNEFIEALPGIFMMISVMKG